MQCTELQPQTLMFTKPLGFLDSNLHQDPRWNFLAYVVNICLDRLF